VRTKKIPAPGQNIQFSILIEDQNTKVSGTIMDILPTGKAKVEYIHPVRGFRAITLVELK
jgi:hypothetical protein